MWNPLETKENTVRVYENAELAESGMWVGPEERPGSNSVVPVVLPSTQHIDSLKLLFSAVRYYFKADCQKQFREIHVHMKLNISCQLARELY